MSETTDIILVAPEEAALRVENTVAVVSHLRDNILVKGRHYGVIPGTRSKPTLLKAGAEMLCSAFGLCPDFETITKVEDWDKPLFHYDVKCRLIHIQSGKLVATGGGSCNSMESKYRWRWVKGQRVENDDIFTQVNTIKKMAQKRALIDAVLYATNASDFFTQDMEDINGIEPGTRRPVIIESVEVTEAKNGKRYLKLRTRNGQGFSVFSREPFRKAGYIGENDWGEVDEMFDVEIPCEIEMGESGYWELVLDSIPEYNPEWEDLKAESSKGDEIPWE